MLERRQAGEIPDKPHTVMRSGEGSLRYEECLTRDGFDGPFSILYHERKPHVMAPASAKHGFALPKPASDVHLQRRHYLSDQAQSPGAPIDARRPLLFNEDVTLSVLHPDADDPVYFSNADGDDLYFVRQGGGMLRSVFGDLKFGAGDYVIVPRGVLHRFVLDDGPQRWLCVECHGGVGLLKQWRNEVGQLRMGAPYTHRDFRSPVFDGPQDEQLRALVTKRSGQFHGYTVEHSPLDVVGWDGAVYPFVFPISRFSPSAGQVHLPPTIHGTFGARGALICSFVPRMLDFGEGAIPCPYPHSSVDVDEVIYYCDGNFGSRRGVGAGSVSFHPAGIPHGPQGDAYESSVGVKQTEELAVMLDCVRPLVPTAQATAVEDADYHNGF